MDGYVKLAREILYLALIDATVRPRQRPARYQARATRVLDQRDDAREFLSETDPEGDLAFWCYVGDLQLMHLLRVLAHLRQHGWLREDALRIHGAINDGF